MHFKINKHLFVLIQVAKCEVGLGGDVELMFKVHSRARDCTTTCKLYSVYVNFDSGFTFVLF